MTGRPEIPGPTSTDPLIEIIAVGSVLVQAFPRNRGLLSFNPTDVNGRFRPVTGSDGRVVPTAYLASDRETALAGGVLRGVTALAATGQAPRRLFRHQIGGVSLGTVRVKKPVRVAPLHGAGLQRLGLTRAAVIDCDEDEYPYTNWAQAIWGCRRRPAGISWTSRQNDTGRAYILWVTRVPPSAFEAVGPIVDLDRDPGLDLVRQACVDAGVDLEG